MAKLIDKFIFFLLLSNIFITNAKEIGNNSFLLIPENEDLDFTEDEHR